MILHALVEWGFTPMRALGERLASSPIVPSAEGTLPPLNLWLKLSPVNQGDMPSTIPDPRHPSIRSRNPTALVGKPRERGQSRAFCSVRGLMQLHLHSSRKLQSNSGYHRQVRNTLDDGSAQRRRNTSRGEEAPTLCMRATRPVHSSQSQPLLSSSSSGLNTHPAPTTLFPYPMCAASGPTYHCMMSVGRLRLDATVS